MLYLVIGSWFLLTRTLSDTAHSVDIDLETTGQSEDGSDSQISSTESYDDSSDSQMSSTESMGSGSSDSDSNGSSSSFDSMDSIASSICGRHCQQSPEESQRRSRSMDQESYVSTQSSISEGDDDDDSDSSDGAESSRGDDNEDGSDSEDDGEHIGDGNEVDVEGENEKENEEEGDDEDECVGLSSRDCGSVHDDDGQQVCGLNIATNECYEVVRSNGVYGRGSFDDGYSAAKKEAEATKSDLNLVVAVMAAVIAVLVLVAVSGLWWIHSARKHGDKLYEMELSQIDDLEDGARAQGIDSTDSAPMLVNVGSPRSPRAATSY